MSAIYIIMDLAMTLMPIRLILSLHRSTSEKILVCSLMTLGLFATAVTCAKMSTFTTFGQGDIMQATIVPSLYAKLEEQIGIIATSLPWLKSPVENWLKEMGILKEHQLTRPSCVAMSLPTVDENTAGDSANSKGNTRVDSVAVTALGTKASYSSLPKPQVKKAWQAV
jgi:hypothetical protein